MLAFMKYENGLKFKNVVFENENAAKVWLKENNITNEKAYELVEIEFVKEDPIALKRIKLNEKLETIRDRMEWAIKMRDMFRGNEKARYQFEKIYFDYFKECKEIEKEINNL